MKNKTDIITKIVTTTIAPTTMHAITPADSLFFFNIEGSHIVIKIFVLLKSINLASFSSGIIQSFVLRVIDTF